MKMERKFNTLRLEEYFYFIDNHKSYKDFNTLGLYRSIIENNNLSIAEKILVRDYAHKYFQKSFDFLQIKDPHTYIAVSTIGQELTEGDRDNIWHTIRKNQEKILKGKRIKHRNFGIYSKHDCGNEDCPYNGMMAKQGSWIAEGTMGFDSDKFRWSRKEKSNRNKSERKNAKQIIKEALSE